MQHILKDKLVLLFQLHQEMEFAAQIESKKTNSVTMLRFTWPLKTQLCDTLKMKWGVGGGVGGALGGEAARRSENLSLLFLWS